MMIFPRKNVPRWLIFLIDLIIVVFSVLLAYLLRFNFSIPDVELKPLPLILAYMLVIRGLSFLIARTSAGIIRYTSTEDALRVVATLISGSMVFAVTNLVTYYFIGKFFFIPFSIIIIDLLVSSFAMICFRLVVKVAYIEFQYPERSKVNVVIYGAGEAGLTAKRVLERDMETKYKVVAFLDDNSSKIGKKAEGIDIYSPEKLSRIVESNSVKRVILAITSFDPDRKQTLVEECLNWGIRVMTVPPMIRWLNGELNFHQIKDIRIEDLLERAEIHLDIEKISQYLAGKVILITGAAGSIGSEIVRQVALYSPKLLILVDQAETPLHDLELECNESYPGVPIRFFLANICNENRMRRIFSGLKPGIVFHAAAYKHVPVQEQNPEEAILTNVLGTRTLADLAMEFNVEKFIMISTDKAVNPTSVMGASKRIAEIYAQSSNQLKKTKFITTRFGNVLGSSGSVIPLFHSQIEKGGPVTITDPNVTRFFMTIPEACELVLEAGALGEGGEIFIFDMGKPVRILDLAEKMIRLSGLKVGKDIQIHYTGLRPGEKLYEELLNIQENTLPTHHPLIMVAKVRQYDLDIITRQISDLIDLAPHAPDMDIVKKMKEIVPEYISQNSVFEQLDANAHSA
ncbi:MAG: nucleoside-diphosphate sugar epimerase/dehydratase [Bacteroidota bacterium]|nr:nucleoside-diphosphate sugar epimerase/dehydratase [Bacteroidota bacterium]